MILSQQKWLRSVVVGALCTAVLVSCQTTGGTRVVDISETRIVFPEGLKSLKGFEIGKAEISESGSFRNESVFFTGGYFSYSRYFHGGFRPMSKNRMRQHTVEAFPTATYIGPIRSVNVGIGQVYYTTFKNDGETCFFMKGNSGPSAELRSGSGSTALTAGLYCEPGHRPDLERRVLKWMKLVKLR